MKEELLTDALLREFLLGKADDEERERIESLFLTDTQTKERLLIIEQDLIEEYLEESLTEEDKQRFLSRYAQTDEQRRKLRITRSIKDWAVTSSGRAQVAAASISFWTRLRTHLRLKPLFVVPIAIAIVIGIILGIVWLERQREQRKHLAVEQELAQLNSPASLRETPPDMISLELRPVTVRSVEPQTEFNPRADNRIVELRLPWINKERYSTYKAEIHRVGGDESFTIPNLQADSEGGYGIRVRLRTNMLRPGSYQIHLTGIANDGSTGLTEEYNFAVGG